MSMPRSGATPPMAAPLPDEWKSSTYSATASTAVAVLDWSRLPVWGTGASGYTRSRRYWAGRMAAVAVSSSAHASVNTAAPSPISHVTRPSFTPSPRKSTWSWTTSIFAAPSAGTVSAAGSNP